MWNKFLRCFRPPSTPSNEERSKFLRCWKGSKRPAGEEEKEKEEGEEEKEEGGEPEPPVKTPYFEQHELDYLRQEKYKG